MTDSDITQWVHMHQATVTICADPEHYTGLMVTVLAGHRTATTGPGWDLLTTMANGIQAWEAGSA